MSRSPAITVITPGGSGGRPLVLELRTSGYRALDGYRKMCNFIAVSNQILERRHRIKKNWENDCRLALCKLYFSRWKRTHTLKLLFYDALKRYTRKYLQKWKSRLHYEQNVKLGLEKILRRYRQKSMKLRWDHIIFINQGKVDFLKKVLSKCFYKKEKLQCTIVFKIWKVGVLNAKGKEFWHRSVTRKSLLKWRSYLRWCKTFRGYIERYYMKRRAIKKLVENVKFYHYGRNIWWGTSLHRVLSKPMLQHRLEIWRKHAIIRKLNRYVATQKIIHATIHFAKRTAFQCLVDFREPECDSWDEVDENLSPSQRLRKLFRTSVKVVIEDNKTLKDNSFDRMFAKRLHASNIIVRRSLGIKQYRKTRELFRTKRFQSGEEEEMDCDA